MDKWKIGEKQETRSGASFFYDRVKQLRTPAEPLATPSSEEQATAPSQGLLQGVEDWSRRKSANRVLTIPTPQIPKAQAEKSAEAALGNWKLQLKEYQNRQRTYLTMKEQVSFMSDEAERKTALQTLEKLESELNRMEWELRQGYRRTRSAVRDFKAAS